MAYAASGILQHNNCENNIMCMLPSSSNAHAWQHMLHSGHTTP